MAPSFINQASRQRIDSVGIRVFAKRLSDGLHEGLIGVVEIIEYPGNNHLGWQLDIFGVEVIDEQFDFVEKTPYFRIGLGWYRRVP